jgi:hypothetical protein
MNGDQGTGILDELKRIRAIAWPAVVVFLLLAFLDGPVTVLGWLLLGSGILCLVYIAAASTLYFTRNHSRN